MFIFQGWKNCSFFKDVVPFPNTFTLFSLYSTSWVVIWKQSECQSRHCLEEEKRDRMDQNQSVQPIDLIGFHKKMLKAESYLFCCRRVFVDFFKPRVIVFRLISFMRRLLKKSVLKNKFLLTLNWKRWFDLSFFMKRSKNIFSSARTL